ncbi:MAG: damage-inducible protein DinB [Rhizobiales bacterium]|nr:damage-inducible protein DinB [Hyphomicrobiales bacterium]
MIDHYRMFADYNRWANERIYTAAAELSEADYRAHKGAFFGSLHGTLNHLLVADRVWMQRFTGHGEPVSTLDQVLHEDLAGLREARRLEDARIASWIDTLAEADFGRIISYTPLTNPQPITHPLGPALAHFFNHQTHHRGQCHTILTGLGKPSVTLDLIYFLRSEGSRWMGPAIAH